ncbi:MAG: HAMP domain-containing histidine kinase [Clostridia bacterium]|nr:HAMP domain-containing histidine kinase [Clostridia bacterium]
MGTLPIIYIVVVLLLAIIIVLGMLVVNFSIQIKQIRKQLRFVAHNKTNQKIRIHTPSREVQSMINDINYLIQSTREEEIEIMRKDKELRDTIVNMSHDIRTPLTSLSGYFDLLISSDDASEKERYAAIIRERIASLSDLLESMFFYTKLSSDSIKADFDKCDISSIFMQSMFSYFDDFERLEITPELDVEEGIEFITDEKLLKRIFQNLIKNVLTHGKDELKVSLKKVNGQQGKPSEVVLIMANKYDTSTNIDVEQVFDRFYQSDKTRNNNSSGIGLAVVLKLSRLLGGNVTARVDGEFFEITLKLKK